MAFEEFFKTKLNNIIGNFVVIIDPDMGPNCYLIYVKKIKKWLTVYFFKNFQKLLL